MSRMDVQNYVTFHKHSTLLCPKTLMHYNYSSFDMKSARFA